MTNADIIEAAYKVWGQKLYRNTSLNDLAHELGVSKQALYRHFKDKQALVNGMTGHFLDDFTAFIRPSYEQTLSQPEPDSNIFNLIRAIAEYMARNVYALTFAMFNVMGRKRSAGIEEQLKKRGVDMKAVFQILKREYEVKPRIIQMIFTTMIFFMAHFHKKMKSFTKTPSELKIKNNIDDIIDVIADGLKFNAAEIDALDFAGLESRVDQTAADIEDNPLLKAVALAVAEAGPWKASVDMIARNSGLSKSSLYGHFKDKKDMLRQLFMTEYEHILAFTSKGIGQSPVAAEQIYLGIFSIAVYLRSRPQILVALDWIRTRNLDLGKPEQGPAFHRLFEEIKVELPQKYEAASAGETRQFMYHWILFLIIGTLMQRERKPSIGKLPNEDIRILFRYIMLGINGFKQNDKEQI